MNNSNNQVIRNVMEVLVSEELARQISSYSPSITNSINSLDIISYALNRLPSLYASSEEGFNYQKLKGEMKLRKQIEAAVKEGLDKVFQEPERPFQPLTEFVVRETKEEKQVKQILLELNHIAPNKDPYFLLKTLEQMLNKIMLDRLTETEIKKIKQQLSFDWEDTRYNF